MPSGASLPPEVHAARRTAYDAQDCDRCAGLSLTPPIGAPGFAAWRKQAGLAPKLGQGRRCPKIMLAGSPAGLHGVAALQAELGRARRDVAHLRGLLAQIVRTAGQAGPPPAGRPGKRSTVDLELAGLPNQAEPLSDRQRSLLRNAADGDGNLEIPGDPAGRDAVRGLVDRGLARHRPDDVRPSLTPSGWALAGVLAPAR